MSVDPRTKIMASIALGVASGVAVAPTTFLGIFGVPEHQVTGATRFGWRLFAARNVAIGVAALRGDATAEAAFLPVQVLDQVVFWHAFAERSVPRRAPVLAAAVSATIVVLDLSRRRSLTAGRSRPAPPG